MTAPLALSDEIDISDDWEAWSIQALLRGASLVDVIDALTSEELAEEAAAAHVGSIVADPVYRQVREDTQRLLKLASVLQIRSSLLDLSNAAFEIPRRSGLSRQEFLEQHYAVNRPVLLTDVCDTWPARERWTIDYLTEIFTGERVEVMSGREDDPDYELNMESHRRKMSFRKFAKIIDGPRGNDVYLTANNRLLDRPNSTALWDDFTLDPRYLSTQDAKSACFLWLGPGGTVTNLHHDVMNIMFHQVRGTKKFTLISPLETLLVYNSQSVYADVNASNPDLREHPLFEQTHPTRITVKPGEALFIPVGWWHHVESLDASASVSANCFVWPNDYDWFEPEL